MILSQLKVFPEGFIIAKNKQGQITGYAAVEKHANHTYPPYNHNIGEYHVSTGKLFYLSVITIEEKSRHQGYGTKLLTQIDRLAKKNNIKAIYCPVNKKHPFLSCGIKSFWEKKGYKTSGEVNWEAYTSKFFEAFIFEKEISP
jgi:GNAT superfamily N-acetyltransferase